jgi:hypothetical protein
MAGMRRRRMAVGEIATCSKYRELAMLKAIFMMLLAVVSSSATAKWVEVDNYDKVTNYVDFATIHRTGDVAKMWILLDYKTVQQYSTNPKRVYLSQISQNEYDCKKERWRILNFSWYSASKGGGATVYNDSDPGKWERVLLGSTIKLLWEIACEQR